MNPMSNKLTKIQIKFIIAGAILGMLIISLYQLYIPPKSKGSSKIINIHNGMNVKDITKLLKEEGIIRNEFLFVLLVRITQSEKELKSGRYKLNPSSNLIEIFKIIKEGKSDNFCVTIPEGYNIYQIASLLEKEGIILDKQRFVDLSQDKDFIGRLNIFSKSLEGYFFPETYCFDPQTKEEHVIEIMVNECKKRVLDNKVYQTQTRFLGLSMHQIITLASIIEKESSAPDERPLVSAVFHNRLKEGMLLESCATVIYALGERFNGRLKRDDLHIDSEYNTYLHSGLPPTPISNPGIKSIESALHPEPVDYLFFVSTGNGRHKFSSNVKEHRENVMRYQIEPYRR